MQPKLRVFIILIQSEVRFEGFHTARLLLFHRNHVEYVLPPTNCLDTDRILMWIALLILLYIINNYYNI